jgi:hypothetical protein
MINAVTAWHIIEYRWTASYSDRLSWKLKAGPTAFAPSLLCVIILLFLSMAALAKSVPASISSIATSAINYSSSIL